MPCVMRLRYALFCNSVCEHERNFLCKLTVSELPALRFKQYWKHACTMRLRHVYSMPFSVPVVLLKCNNVAACSTVPSNPSAQCKPPAENRWRKARSCWIGTAVLRPNVETIMRKLWYPAYFFFTFKSISTTCLTYRRPLCTIEYTE